MTEAGRPILRGEQGVNLRRDTRVRTEKRADRAFAAGGATALFEVLRQERNRGPSAARNRALEVLDTNYVLPIDADDKLLEQLKAPHG